MSTSLSFYHWMLAHMNLHPWGAFLVLNSNFYPSLLHEFIIFMLLYCKVKDLAYIPDFLVFEINSYFQCSPWHQNTPCFLTILSTVWYLCLEFYSVSILKIRKKLFFSYPVNIPSYFPLFYIPPSTFKFPIVMILMRVALVGSYI